MANDGLKSPATTQFQAITPEEIADHCARAQAQALELDYRLRFFGPLYGQHRHHVTREEVELRLAVHCDIVESLLHRLAPRLAPEVQKDLAEILRWYRNDRRRIICDLFELDEGRRAARTRNPEAYAKQGRASQVLRAFAAIVVTGGTIESAAKQLGISQKKFDALRKYCPEGWQSALEEFRRRLVDRPEPAAAAPETAAVPSADEAVPAAASQPDEARPIGDREGTA